MEDKSNITPSECLISCFKNIFGTGDNKPLYFFFSPGRVNLIGEHIDYCGGNVLPAAVSMGIQAIVRYRNDDTIRFFSVQKEEKLEINFHEKIEPWQKGFWGNYPAGVIAELVKEGWELKGFDAAVGGNIPEGAGLSSSAAIEVLTAIVAVYPVYGDGIDKVRLALTCQRAEKNFAGVSCGIMDQFAVLMGKQGHAIFLNCSTLNYNHVPVSPGEYELIIINTGKSRKLDSSLYNRRRQETEEALKILKGKTLKPLENLVDFTVEDVERYITDNVLRKRAIHVVTENRRVIDAASALEKGDMMTFGQLMNESHLSLRDNYEVTGNYLDAVFSAGSSFNGCIGIRMTGAGFGGCAIAFVEKGRVDEFVQTVRFKTKTVIDMQLEFYRCDISGGAGFLQNV